MLLNTHLLRISKLASIESTTGFTDITVDNQIGEFCTTIYTLETLSKKPLSPWQHKNVHSFTKVSMFVLTIKQALHWRAFQIGMGRYRYQIFDTIDTGLRSDGIDTRKQYRSVSIHVRAALRKGKVYVSTLSTQNQ